MSSEIEVTVRSAFAYNFKADSLPPGVTSETPDEEGNIAVLLNNDNINDLWPKIDAARRTELIEGRYVIVSKGPGVRTVPLTPIDQAAGTDPSPRAAHKTVTRKGERE